MQIVFLGSGAFGIPTLEMLSREHDLLAIVTQPDRPAGRKRRLTPTPVGAWAAEHRPDVPLLKPEDVNDPDVRDRIRSYDTGTPEARRGGWVVIAFGQKLSPELVADRFAINLHASLLPRWRGAAPIARAILAGDTETGNTVITIADRMDAGLILGASRRPIEPHHTAGELHDLLAADGPALMADVLRRYEQGRLEPEDQDESRVTLARKLRKADGAIEEVGAADELRRKIHAFNPWPGVTLRFRGEALKVHRAEALTPDPEQAGGGAGILVDAGRGVLRCAGGSLLRLLEVQPAGKRATPWDEFARGARPEAGERLAGAE